MRSWSRWPIGARVSTRRVAGASALALALMACSSDGSSGDDAAGGAAGHGSGGAGHGGSLFSAAGGDGGDGGDGGAGALGGGPTAGGGGTIAFSAEVACAGATCAGATPVCCVPPGEQPTCNAYMGSLSCGDAPAVTMFCDDATDCLAGQVCCVDENADNGGVYSCTYAPCATHEACTPGGSCAQAGYVCVADAQQASGAKCVLR